MREVTEPEELRNLLTGRRCEDKSIGLVPTMGHLHEGHLHLLDEARRENDIVVLSVFVNPTQFSPNEDFERYPRDLERDRRLANQSKVDILFTPTENSMYPRGPSSQEVWVDPGALAEYLCGPSRPGHFEGVATVVAKLFVMVQPDAAYFGQKDAQQSVIVSKLACDLNFAVRVRVVPTVREGDGLARSSRNVYLSADERREAVALFGALSGAESLLGLGERDPRVLEKEIWKYIAEKAPSARIDYVSAVDLYSLLPAEAQLARPTLIAVAALFGSTRLIDNTIVDFISGEVRFGWPSTG
jgi:pantoate--beta-alanine ligase